ncbi:hypothetical protein Hanom_Chr07g00614471 [Helianthus anomalus]
MKVYKNTNILMDLEDFIDLEHHVQHQTSFGSSSTSNRHLKHHRTSSTGFELYREGRRVEKKGLCVLLVLRIEGVDKILKV